MRIAVIGAGNVGGTLGRRWAELGHEVVFGVRDPGRGAAAVKGGDPTRGGELPAGARLATPAEAVRGADGWRAEAVLLATPWEGARDAIAECGPGALDGLVLLDATNPLGPAPGGGLTLVEGPGGASAAEQVQGMAPGARVVKAFNTTGYDNMRDPVYGGAPTAMFYAGDDAEAKRSVQALAEGLGFEAVDAGPLVRARELERLAMLWISLAFGGAGVPGLGRDFAFRLVRR